MTISNVAKAISAAITAGFAVEATGVVTGVANHYLTIGIVALCAIAGAFGITYRVPNRASQSASVDVLEHQEAMAEVWNQGVNKIAGEQQSPID